MPNYTVPLPPENLFSKDSTPLKQVVQSENLYFIEREEYPPEGGIYIYKFSGEPEENEGKVIFNNVVRLLYPEKGFRNPNAVVACNWAKRILINQIKFLMGIKYLLIFLPNKLKKFGEWLKGYNEISEKVLIPYFYADPIRYCNICRELRVLIREFLGGIGINDIESDLFAKIFITLIEHDEAYRYRIEDILSETTKEDMLKNPRKEIRNLLQIFSQRETKRPHLVQKFKWIGQGLSLALFVPRIRKAFTKALTKIDFTKLQLDRADRYHVLRLDGYEFMGRPIEDRIKEFSELHLGNPPVSVKVGLQ